MSYKGTIPYYLYLRCMEDEQLMGPLMGEENSKQAWMLQGYLEKHSP